MLKNILNTLSNNKKTILYFIIFFVAFFALFDLASANTWTQSASDARFEEMKQTASVVVEFFIKIIIVFLSLITFLAALFLSPEWYNWSIFWLNWYFKDIWIIVSNFVYFVFAFILIWIAFMNIIWKWQDKYALKQALPKFVVWIFIVPISWFLVQFTLSVVSVLSIAALNLPFDTFKSFENDINKISLQTNCTLNLSDISNQSNSVNNNQALKFFDCPDWEKKLGDFLDSKAFTDSIFWVVWVYTYWILDLKTVSTLSASDINAIKTIWDLVVKILFDLLFIVIYSILMIALWLVLFTRWIYLWVYIMISPVFWLMYFFWKSDWGSWFFEKFNVKEFLSLAMVPVYTMLALSLWLLFLYVIWQWVSSDWTDYQSNFFRIVPSEDKSSTTLIIWEDSAKLTILWWLDPSNESSFLKDIWNWSLWVVWTLIMKIFWVVVLWMAVMAALSSSKITREIIKPLKDFWDQVWSLASKAPQYAPIFGGQSMQSLNNIWTQAQWYMSTKATERSNKFIKDNWLFWNDSYIQWMQTNIINAQRATAPWQIKDSIEEAFRLMNWNETRLNQKEFKDLLDAITKSNQAPEAFKTFMAEKSWQSTLNTNEVMEALKKLETINDDFNFNKIGTIGTWTSWDLIRYIRSLKWTEQQPSSPNPWNPPAWNPPAWNQTINLNIKNWNTNLPISLNNVTLTDEQKANFSNIDINNLQNRSELISELQQIWITDTMIITNIIDDIIRLLWTNWDKFK